MDLICLPRWKKEVYADKIVSVVDDKSLTLACGGIVLEASAFQGLIGYYYVQHSDHVEYVEPEEFEREYTRIT